MFIFFPTQQSALQEIGQIVAILGSRRFEDDELLMALVCRPGMPQRLGGSPYSYIIENSSYGRLS